MYPRNECFQRSPGTGPAFRVLPAEGEPTSQNRLGHRQPGHASLLTSDHCRRTFSAVSQFAKYHEECLRDSRSAVVAFNDGHEILLAPAFSVLGTSTAALLTSVLAWGLEAAPNGAAASFTWTWTSARP
jgi:hypothetical protein